LAQLAPALKSTPHVALNPRADDLAYYLPLSNLAKLQSPPLGECPRCSTLLDLALQHKVRVPLSTLFPAEGIPATEAKATFSALQ
jgi:hypothetical protein